MPYGLYLSAAGAEAQSRRVEILSHNMANANTPGFKRELAVLQARHSEAIEQNLDQAGSGGINDVSGGVYLQDTLTDYAGGPFKATNGELDFAIEDQDAFFLVAKNGEQHLTRAGNFLFTNDGQLKTQDGYTVLGQSGEPIVMDPTQPWTFSANGVFNQLGSKHSLGIVRPQSRGDLVRVGDNLFRPLGPTTPLISGQERPQIWQGFLEMSGVNSTQEMVELIEATRAYEANIKMIQNQDHVIGALIGRVLAS